MRGGLARPIEPCHRPDARKSQAWARPKSGAQRSILAAETSKLRSRGLLPPGVHVSTKWDAVTVSHCTTHLQTPPHTHTHTQGVLKVGRPSE